MKSIMVYLAGLVSGVIGIMLMLNLAGFRQKSPDRSQFSVNDNYYLGLIHRPIPNQGVIVTLYARPTTPQTKWSAMLWRTRLIQGFLRTPNRPELSVLIPTKDLEKFLQLVNTAVDQTHTL